MFTFLLWCVLLFFCWPLALIALVLYPIVWLLLLPFRYCGGGSLRAAEGDHSVAGAGAAGTEAGILETVKFEQQKRTRNPAAPGLFCDDCT
jgi:hypothetical protein